MDTTNVVKKAILDRNNTKKVRYITDDRKHSTLTINPILYELIRIKFGEPQKVISKIASEVRRSLIEKAEALESRGELFDVDKKGEVIATTAQSWVRGKISHHVTNTIILEIADPKLIDSLT